MALLRPLAGVILSLAACAALFAQEGHPLTGTWSGDYVTAGAQRMHVTVIMSWDGKKISGIVNPGPNSRQLDDVSIDFATWTVRYLVNERDAAGNVVPVVAEGKLEDLASPHRTIRGTWKQGQVSGEFRLTRD